MREPSARQLPSERIAEARQAKFNFPKTARLLTPKDFQQVFSQAEKFANRHWTFIVQPNQLDYARLGLAISKKQLAKAVWRNRVKRIARESFRHQQDKVAGYDIVILGRKGTELVENQQLAKSFFHLMDKLRKSGLKNKVKEQQA